MLEKMGWSKGKGLGKSEQGSTEHVKVKLKNNSLGLGTSTNHEDNWIAHQDDFSKLLADLNSCHSQNASEETQHFSLEEKSKTSRKRVHYMKFTKGKDLSNRSETDLACIFGKRMKKAKKEEEDSSSSQESQDERVMDVKDVKPEVTPDLDVETTLNTVTSRMTMQEYFAKRMAQLKRSRAGTWAEPSPSPASEESPDSSEVEKLKSKKKKKKRSHEEHQEKEEVVTEDVGDTKEATEWAAPEENCADADSHTTIKKKKSKRREVTPGTVEMDTHVEGDGESPEVDKKEKKKRKKRRREEEKEKEEEEPERVTKKKSKKKKRDYSD
ncbi:PINX1 inhibitor, partial [Amia calva]|nr:PINX1 inhibitor [Amia calva]